MRATGMNEHLARLRAMRGPDVVDAAYRGIYAAASMVATEARHSITAGSISGKGHIPSKPGEPPNADTHHLDTGIFIEGDKAALNVKVVSSAPHGLDLEFGTSKMAERPYMRQASLKVGHKAVQFIAKYISQIVRKR